MIKKNFFFPDCLLPILFNYHSPALIKSFLKFLKILGEVNKWYYQDLEGKLSLTFTDPDNNLYLLIKNKQQQMHHIETTRNRKLAINGSGQCSSPNVNQVQKCNNPKE